MEEINLSAQKKFLENQILELINNSDLMKNKNLYLENITHTFHESAFAKTTVAINLTISVK